MGVGSVKLIKLTINDEEKASTVDRLTSPNKPGIQNIAAAKLLKIVINVHNSCKDILL
jgi:hypothetical protein